MKNKVKVLFILIVSYLLSSCTFQTEQVVTEYDGNRFTDLFIQKIIGPRQINEEKNWIIQEGVVQLSPSKKIELCYSYFHKGCPNNVDREHSIILEPNEQIIFPDGAIIKAYPNSLKLIKGNYIRTVNEDSDIDTFERREDGSWQDYYSLKTPIDYV